LTRLTSRHDAAYQHTSSAVEIERGRASWEPDDGHELAAGVAPPPPARIVPLKPSAMLEQLVPRERELLALVALGLSNTMQAVALAPDRRAPEHGRYHNEPRRARRCQAKCSGRTIAVWLSSHLCYGSCRHLASASRKSA
jgi:hypothetical protein